MEEPRILEERIISRTPEEELAKLKERVKEKEKELELGSSAFERERIAKRELVRYADEPAKEVLHDAVVMPEHDVIRESLALEPETHDKKVDKLLRIAMEKGIKNALSVAARLGNSHVEDDFHRALIRYIAQGFPTKGLSEGTEMWKALHMTLFEMHPEAASGEREKRMEELLMSTEQLYAGLLTMAEGGEHIALEIAVAEGTEEVVFYIAVPNTKASLLERQVHSVFPNAHLEECRGDYNIFNFEGSHAGAYVTLSEHPALPLKTYKTFEHDPMNVLLSAFTRLQKHGEGAAFQIIIGNEGDRYNSYYKKIAGEIQKGESLNSSLKVPETTLGDFAKEVKGALFSKKKSEDDKFERKDVDTHSLELVREKASMRVVPVTIRAIASAKDSGRADEILEYLTSTVNQFDNAEANRMVIEKVRGRTLSEFFREFTMRTFSKSHIAPLNLSELTSLFHFTAEGVSTSRELKQSRSKQSAAPLTLSGKGIVLGINTYGSSETRVQFAPEDRLRHFYTIGQTGTGKTTLMKNMIIQDIQNGDGVCYIDPHGSDIEDILANIPPEREKDVVYFNPAHTEDVMGLNMLEYDTDHPELKTLVVDELYDIFRKLYSDTPEAFGPMFEQYYRNATMLVLEDPSSGNSLIEISRVLSDPAFRRLKLSRCKNPLVVQFWEKIAVQAGGEAALENIVPYITSKFDVFLANDIMRPIVAQEKSAFNFRAMMDDKKIFLVNLAKGRIGDRNANLLGLIIVGKFLHAALSRADTRDEKPVFHLYIDEFQNFTTPAIATIFSEARKYRLSLNVAHQFIAQLSENIRDAVFGNVGTKCVFRVGSEDATFLENTFAPTFTAADLEHIDNYHAYLSLLVNGTPSPAFDIRTEKPDKGAVSRVDELAQVSYLSYGRKREEVEQEIAEKFKTIT